MDKKNQQSKSQFGTLTAKSDANQDYTSQTGASSSAGKSGMSGMTSSTMGSTTSGSTMGSTSSSTLTSAYDPNDQYQKKGGQQQQTSTQAGQKKPSK